MIPILSLLDPLARLAAAALEHVNLRKSAAPHSEAERLKELEESDLEQAELIRELSENVNQLARNIELQLETQQRREARLLKFCYLCLGLALISLAVAVFALLK